MKLANWIALIPFCCSWILAIEDQPLPKAHVAQVQGSVQVFQSGEIYSGSQALPGVPLFESSLLQTGDKSRAEIEFEDFSITRIGANTIFAFDAKQRHLDLKSGSILLQIYGAGQAVKVTTKVATAAVTGTTLLVEADEKMNSSSFYLFETSNLEGVKIESFDGKASVVIRPGQFIDADESGVSPATPFDRIAKWKTSPLGQNSGELRHGMDILFSEIASQSSRQQERGKTDWSFDNILNQVFTKLSNVKDDSIRLRALTMNVNGDVYLSRDRVAFVKLTPGVEVEEKSLIQSAPVSAALFYPYSMNEMFVLGDTLTGLNEMQVNARTQGFYGLSHLDLGSIMAEVYFSSPLSVMEYETPQAMVSIQRGSLVISFFGNRGEILAYQGDARIMLSNGQSMLLRQGDALELYGIGREVNATLRNIKEIPNHSSYLKLQKLKHDFMPKDEELRDRFYTISQSTFINILTYDFIPIPILIDTAISTTLPPTPIGPVVSPVGP